MPLERSTSGTKNNNKHIYNTQVASITDPEARSTLHNVIVQVDH